MTKRTGPTNIELKALISQLNEKARKEKINLWKRVAYELNKSTRKRADVNLDKINKYTRNGEIALIPGKVLGKGEINKKIKVAAYNFSKSSKDKLKDNAILLKDLMKDKIKGKRIRIIK